MFRDVVSPEELVKRLADGTFEEKHSVEAKRALGDGPKANVELARDLASLAVDGGVLVFGVAEDKERRLFTPHPVPLKGFAERIEQVASTRISPRLPVRFCELPYDDGTGFLLVEVPTSPEAPHMVEHSYYGRGDTTKHRLADDDVRRLLDRRRIRQDEFAALLAREAERDPTPDQLREQAHLSILARPATGRPRMLHDALEVDGKNLRSWAQTEILHGPAGAWLEWPSPGWLEPDISSNILSVATRAHGIGFHTYDAGADRVPTPNGDHPPRERNLLDFEVDEDGTLHVFSTVSDYGRNGSRRMLIDPLPATLVLRVARAAVAVSDASRYLGAWHVGLHIANLRGVVSSDSVQFWSNPMVAYTADHYEAQGEFLVDTLASDEKSVVMQLCGGLFRGLGRPLNLP